MKRPYRPAEVEVGKQASEKLAEAIHTHTKNCDCALCKAWWALRPVDVYGWRDLKRQGSFVEQEA